MYVIGVFENGKLHHILAKIYWTYEAAEHGMAQFTDHGERAICELRTV